MALQGKNLIDTTLTKLSKLTSPIRVFPNIRCMP